MENTFGAVPIPMFSSGFPVTKGINQSVGQWGSEGSVNRKSRWAGIDPLILSIQILPFEIMSQSYISIIRPHNKTTPELKGLVSISFSFTCPQDSWVSVDQGCSHLDLNPSCRLGPDLFHMQLIFTGLCSFQVKRLEGKPTHTSTFLAFAQSYLLTSHWLKQVHGQTQHQWGREGRKLLLWITEQQSNVPPNIFANSYHRTLGFAFRDPKTHSQTRKQERNSVMNYIS